METRRAHETEERALQATDRLVSKIRDSIIGRDEIIDGPFGPRPVVYADYTASGRSLTFIEDYLRDVVLPLYANTHTEASGTGLQTTRFREEARSIIASCVGATEEHAVLFCGSGATGAIDKLIGVLGLRLPSTLDDRYGVSAGIAPEDRPVVFIGPYEHHSNELPWRESIADVVIIDENADGHVCLEHLERELVTYADRPVKIGSFSAASNVTGIITDTDAVSALLHDHGALALWDFAAAAPYVGIEMNGSGTTAEPRVQGCGVHLAAQDDRRAGDAGCARRPSRPVHQSGSRRPRRRLGHVREHERTRLPPGDRTSGGGRHARHRRVDPGGARVPAQASGRRRRDHPARTRLRQPRHRLVGRRPPHHGARQPRRGSVCRSSRS